MGRQGVVAGILALVLATHVGAQCNNTSRIVQVTGGLHNTVTHDCTQLTLTVTVLGQQAVITTPGQCTSGGANYLGTVYSCGMEVEEVHCDAMAYKVNLIVYSPEPNCPAPPANLSFESLEEAVQATGCRPPVIANATFDWSAGVRRCPGGPITESDALHGTWADAGDGSALYWDGELDDALVLFPPLADFDPWMGTNEPSAGPPHPFLASVLAAYGPLDLAQVSATITTTPSGDAAPQQVVVDGVWAADGRFEASVRFPGTDPEGRPTVLVSRVAFDGALFTAMTEGAPEAMAWLPGTDRAAQAFRRHAYWAPVVMSWLTNPLGIDLASEQAWSSATPSPTEQIIWRDSNGFRQQLALDLVDGTHPTSMQKWSAGVLYKTLEFSEVLTLPGGVHRPARTVALHCPTAPGGPSVVDLDIHRASVPVELDATFGRVDPSGGRWLVLP